MTYRSNLPTSRAVSPRCRQSFYDAPGYGLSVSAIKVQDMRGPYVVFDGEFLEKLPARGATNRRLVSEFSEVRVEHKPRLDELAAALEAARPR
jgi:hypothetical protein